MQILFVRHGNTFDPGDKVVWVGGETDLPLVDKGGAQAQAVAEALRRCNLVPDRIFAASLQRTRRTADIIAAELGLPPPIVDERLDELNYGRWAGRSNDEIAAGGPAARAAMEAWNSRDIWPGDAGWVSREADVRQSLDAFAAERLAGRDNRRPLVVSSNGILRFLPRLLLPVDLFRPSFKMRTGHLGIVEREGDRAQLRCWDVPPGELR